MKSEFIAQKAVISGNVVEICEYEFGYSKGYEKNSKGRANQTTTSSEQKTYNRSKVMQRARQRLRRLVNANLDLTKFVTLTFKENQTELKQANKAFKDFILRLKYYCKTELSFTQLKYVCVVEFQQRGAVHYHLLCNLPYINSNRLNEIWSHGFVKISRIDNVDNVGAYITKYMSKDAMDARLIGNRSYFTSFNLEQPYVIYNPDVIAELRKVTAIRKYTTEFVTAELGKITYTQIMCEKSLSIFFHSPPKRKGNRQAA